MQTLSRESSFVPSPQELALAVSLLSDAVSQLILSIWSNIKILRSGGPENRNIIVEQDESTVGSSLHLFEHHSKFVDVIGCPYDVPITPPKPITPAAGKLDMVVELGEQCLRNGVPMSMAAYEY